MPSPSGPPGGHHAGAAVIQLRKTQPWQHTPSSAASAAMDPLDGAAVREPDAGHDPHTELATVIEAMFLAQHRTLTDPDTALAFQTGIDSARLAIDAALAQGAVSEHGHQQISNILAHMRTVPAQL